MFKTPSGDAWLFALVCAAGSLAGCLHEWNITRRAAKRFYESSICADRIKYLVPSSVNMFGFEVKNWFLHGGRFFFCTYRRIVGFELTVGSLHIPPSPSTHNYNAIKLIGILCVMHEE